MPLDPSFLVEREIDLVGRSAFAGELPEVAAALPRLAARLAPMISDRISLQQVPDAYAAHVAGRARGLKTIMLPD